MQKLRFFINAILKPFNFQLVHLLCDAGSFLNYLESAKKEGMDVNDWIEQKLGWPAALPTLEKIVFPHLKEGDTVCEVGVGTGRWSRQILTKIPSGKLLLVDSSTWVVNFLKQYFGHDERVSIFLNDTKSLPDISDQSVNLIFSDGTFTGMKLGYIHLYSKECARILKPGGYIVFDYHDTTNPAAWENLEKQSEIHYGFNTYHETATIDRVLAEANFEPVTRHDNGKSTYVVFQKKCRIALPALALIGAADFGSGT